MSSMVWSSSFSWREETFQSILILHKLMEKRKQSTSHCHLFKFCIRSVPWYLEPNCINWVAQSAQCRGSEAVFHVVLHYVLYTERGASFAPYEKCMSAIYDCFFESPGDCDLQVITAVMLWRLFLVWLVPTALKATFHKEKNGSFKLDKCTCIMYQVMST